MNHSFAILFFVASIEFAEEVVRKLKDFLKEMLKLEVSSSHSNARMETQLQGHQRNLFFFQTNVLQSQSQVKSVCVIQDISEVNVKWRTRADNKYCSSTIQTDSLELKDLSNDSGCNANQVVVFLKRVT